MEYLGLDKQLVSNEVEKMNQLLANYHVYYQKLRNYHWNLKGQNFFQLHQQFEDMYNDAKLKIDDIAERILTIRHRPVSTLKSYLEMSTITESEEQKNDRDMIEDLLSDQGKLIQSLREVIEAADEANDEGTIDMTGSFLDDVEKMSWMMEAWATRLDPVDA
jgi:starvation-inducible DNA-binding protein